MAGRPISRSRGCYLRCRIRCLHRRYVVSVRSCTAASARRQYRCTAGFLYTCIRRSETSAGACRRTDGNHIFGRVRNVSSDEDPRYRIIKRQWSRYTHFYFYIRDEVLGPHDPVRRFSSPFPLATGSMVIPSSQGSYRLRDSLSIREEERQQIASSRRAS